MDIESRLHSCLSRWQLHRGEPLTGGFRSAVFECTTAAGTEVVVKLGATAEEMRVEAAALRAWADTGAAVRLVDTDLVLRALLLERVRPGTCLPPADDCVVVEAAASVLDRLHRVPVPTFPFPALAQYYQQAEKRARADAQYERRSRGEPNRGQLGLQRVAAARATARRLCASTARTALLHGDFCAKNLLSSGSGFVAIDPLPCLGDPCADVGFFAATGPPAAGILHRAAAVADFLDLDQQRAQEWAAVWAILQACQAWREDQDELEARLSDPDFERLVR